MFRHIEVRFIGSTCFLIGKSVNFIKKKKIPADTIVVSRALHFSIIKLKKGNFYENKNVCLKKMFKLEDKIVCFYSIFIIQPVCQCLGADMVY